MDSGTTAAPPGAPIGPHRPQTFSWPPRVLSGSVQGSRYLCRRTNMSAFKRKRGGQAPANKNAKKAKFVAGGGEAKQEKKNEVTIPAPVSLVSYRAR